MRSRERQRANRRKKHAMERAERFCPSRGYSDPTADAAIRHVDAERAKSARNCPKT